MLTKNEVRVIAEKLDYNLITYWECCSRDNYCDCQNATAANTIGDGIQKLLNHIKEMQNA